MAIDYKTRYASKIDTTDPTYKYGKARNVVTSGDGTGTPWEADLINDLFGFEQSVLDEAGITPSGVADKIGASQYLDGLKKLLKDKSTTVTEAEAVADTSAKEGDVVVISDRGNGLFEYKSSLINPPNTYDVIGHTTLALSLVLVSDTTKVNPEWVGMKTDDSQDNSPHIQFCLDNYKHTLVPAGTIRCDVMIEVDTDVTLELAGGAYLVRTTDTTNTDPVVWVKGSNSSLIGAGQLSSRIASSNKAPKGVLLIGHWSMAESHGNVQYNTISKIGVLGSTTQGQTTGDPDTAIMIQNPQIGDLVAYFQTISDVYVAQANYGIWLRGWANGNTISNIQGYRLGDDTVNGGAMFYDNGSLDNSITGAFFHQSHNSIGIKLEQLDNTGNAGGNIHSTYANSYRGIVCEQGGNDARGIYAADGTVDGSFFEVRHNTAGGNILDAAFEARNTFFGLYTIQTKIKAEVANPTEFNYLNDDGTSAQARERAFSLGGMEEATTYKLITINNNVSSRNTLVELTVADIWGSGISTSAAEKALFVVRKDGAGTVTVETLIHDKVGSSSPIKGLVQPHISGDDITFSYITGNNGTATTNQSVFVKAVVVGAYTSVVYHQSLTAGTSAPVLRGNEVIKYFAAGLNATLPTYETDLAAATLNAGDFYQTITGELRVKL